MKVVVYRSPKLLKGFLKLIFGIKEQVNKFIHNPSDRGTPCSEGFDALYEHKAKTPIASCDAMGVRLSAASNICA